MKGILRDTLQKSPEALARCEIYATQNGFSNIDYLLEQMIYHEKAFNPAAIGCSATATFFNRLR